MTACTPEWERYIGPEDRAVIARAQFGQRMGFGSRPALLAIDCQRYMVGLRGVVSPSA